MATKLFKCGDLVTDVLADVIYLWGKMSADNNVTHLRLPWTTVGYQVTAGKTLYLARILSGGNENAALFKLGYADNDVGLDTTTARTNPVMATGLDDTAVNGLQVPPASTGASGQQVIGSTMALALLMKWGAASKFLFIRGRGNAAWSGGGVLVHVWGFEV